MDQLLIALFYLLRPVFFVDIDATLGGFSFFEAATVLLTGMLVAVALHASVSKRRMTLTAVEWWILAFVIWCTAALLIQWSSSSVRTYAQWVLPPLTYIVLRRAIANTQSYWRCLSWTLAGFAVPILWSGLLIFRGEGFGEAVYATGLERYQGVYSNIHNMGHSMALYLMLLAIVLIGRRERFAAIRRRIPVLLLLLFSAVALVSLYCLTSAHVRTAYVGLLAFVSILLWFRNRWALAGVWAAGVVLALLFVATLQTLFFDVAEAIEGERDLSRVGSGRPFIWNHNLNVYSGLGIDQMLSGVGFGNVRGGASPDNGVVEPGAIGIGAATVWNSHNDFLETLMQTGLIGLMLLLGVYWSMGRAIWRIQGAERHAYLALFLTILLMNFLSNSYLSRFGLAQLFFMTLVYVELPSVLRRNVATGPVPARVRHAALPG